MSCTIGTPEIRISRIHQHGWFSQSVSWSYSPRAPAHFPACLRKGWKRGFLTFIVAT